jgi:pSer/pThr/pTyr-binding forkhead associated (FHA) protein
MLKACIIVEEKIAEKRVLPLYSKLTIGRASANDIFLPDATVSKRHAALGRVKGLTVVKDLGSHNGTFVNGKQVEKAILASGDGIKVGRIRLRFVQEEEIIDSSTAEDSKEFKFEKRLGEYLVNAGIIQEFALQATLAKQKKNQTIGQVLTAMGVVDDEDIAMALAKQLNVPLVRLDGLEISDQVLSLVPAEVAKTNMLMPIMLTEGKLHIAMANPLDSDAIQVVRVMSRMSVEVSVTPQRELLDAFRGYYPSEFLNEVLDGAPDLDDVTVDI